MKSPQTKSVLLNDVPEGVFGLVLIFSASNVTVLEMKCQS